MKFLTSAKIFGLLVGFALVPVGGAKSYDGPVSIMTFNVENLFDTRDDVYKNDETYLPKSKKSTAGHLAKCQKIEVAKWRDECVNLDWNDALLAQKIQKLGKIIAGANAGKGADVVFLQEVENLRVLEQLNKEGLSQLGYRAVLIEGDDVRGIDVAVLTRLPVESQRLLKIPFKNIGNRIGDTRGILNVRIKIANGPKLSLLAVHLPAPFHPVEFRVQALKYLDEVAQKESSDGYVVVAAGDFNIPSKEEQEEGILKPYLKGWSISHHLGCKTCKGSSYYNKDKSWSFLDQIWFYHGRAGSAAGAWQVDPASITTVKILDEQVDPETTGPKSVVIAADGKSSSGVSDHWPMFLQIRPVK